MKKILFVLLLFLGLAGGHTPVLAQEDYYKKDSLPDRQEKKSTFEKDADVRIPNIHEDPDLAGMTFGERLRFGGNFGLAFGTITNVNISPMAGYQLTNKLVAGAGLTYMFFHNRHLVISKSSHIYGGRAFMMYSVIPSLNLIGEYEALNVTYYDYKKSNYPYKSRTWLGSPMIGLGYMQPIGGGKLIRGAHLSLLYNLNYNNQNNPSVNAISAPENISPYASPFVIRVSFL